MANPFPMYHAMRAHDPVMWHEATKTFIVSAYEPARAIMQDDETFHQAFEHREVSRNGEQAREQPYFELFSRMLFLTDGSTHKRLRPLFSRWFMGPQQIRYLTPIVERVAREVLDELEGRDSFDIVKEFANPLPLRVISELLGVPASDSAAISSDIHSAVAIIESVQKPPEVKAKADAAMVRLKDYFRDLTNERRKNLGEDLLSAMIQDFDAGKFLDETELLANTILMYIGGHETTTDSMSLAVLSLFRNPDELQRLRADPSIMRTAVEELIRYDGTAQGFSRAPVRDVQVGDKIVPAGTFILMLIGAANRDPSVFPDPDRLDLTRGAVKAVGFGGGAHVCVANMLARLELNTGLTELLKRKPNLSLETTSPPLEDFKPSLTRGLLRLQAHC